MTIVNTMTATPIGMPNVVTPLPSFCASSGLSKATSRMKP
jgi:hypothetical protein